MTTNLYECERCHELRIAAHMIGSLCVFCPKSLPRLAPPPAPYLGHPDIRPPQDDPLTEQLRKLGVE